MEDDLHVTLALVLPLLVVLGSLLHGFYVVFFARLGLFNRRLYPREDTPRHG